MKDSASFWIVSLDDGAFMPTHAHDADAGYDLLSPRGCTVDMYDSVTIDTGVHILIPDGFAGRLCAKSGLNVNHGIISTGLIDAGYTGSIRVKLYNLTDKPYQIKQGDKISQIVFFPVESPVLVPVKRMPVTPRGVNGFGSTGR